MGTEKHVLPDTEDMLSNRVKKSSTGLEQQKTIFGPDNNVISVVDMEIGSDLTNVKKAKGKSSNPFGV
ncbi:MAG: hypothetical protein AAGU27_24225 [Dehalobacterium sp.]